MKKLLTLSLALIMMLSLAACGNSGSSSEQTEAIDISSENTSTIQKPEKYDSETLVYAGGARDFKENFGEFIGDYQYVKGADEKIYKYDDPTQTSNFDENAVDHFYLCDVMCRKYADGHINILGYSITNVKGDIFHYVERYSPFGGSPLELLSFENGQVYINQIQPSGIKMTAYDNAILKFYDPATKTTYDKVDEIIYQFNSSTFAVKIGNKTFCVEYNEAEDVGDCYQVSFLENIDGNTILDYDCQSGFVNYKNKSDNKVYIDGEKAINLPDGYTVTDIKDIKINRGKIAVWFNDNAVYLTAESGLTKNDEISKYAAAGYIGDLITLQGDFAVLMDDNCLYLIENKF